MKPMEAQVILLRDINAAKDKLFGPFTHKRTNKVKIQIWKDICDKAKSLGLLGRTKDYKYMRDVYWQNMRRSALQRRERYNITGRRFARTPVLELILEIIDSTSSLHQAEPSQLIPVKKSPEPTCSLAPIKSIGYHMNEDVDYTAPPVFTELGHVTDRTMYVGETKDEAANGIDPQTLMIDPLKAANVIDPQSSIIDYLNAAKGIDPPNPNIDDLKEEPNVGELETQHEIEEPSTSNEHEEAEATNDTIIKANYVISEPNAKDSHRKDEVEENAEDSNEYDVEIKMKKIKTQLKIDLLELQKYKAQLEVLRLEINLGIRPSKFTEAIAKRIKKKHLTYESDVDNDVSDFSIDVLVD